jgi:hypothetical protein
LGHGKECLERDRLDFDERYLKCQAAIDFGSTHSIRVRSGPREHLAPSPQLAKREAAAT